MIVDSELGLTVNPCPLNPEDIAEQTIIESSVKLDLENRPEPLNLETDIPGSDTGVKASIFLGTMPSPTPLVLGKVEVDLPIYPGTLGWYISPGCAI